MKLLKKLSYILSLASIENMERRADRRAERFHVFLERLWRKFVE